MTTVDPREPWLTAGEAAAALDISKRQLANLEERGLETRGYRQGKRYHPRLREWHAEFKRLAAAARAGWPSWSGGPKKPPGWPRLSMRIALARHELREAYREAKRAA